MSKGGHPFREYGGILGALKARLDNNRIGELLLAHEMISPVDLREALALQKASRQPLGRILRQQQKITGFAMRRILAEQMALRTIAACVAIVLSFSCLGGVRTARAGTDMIRDIPAAVSVMPDIAMPAFTPMTAWPSLFGSEERASTNIKPFVKWSGMFDRFDREMQANADQPDIAALRRQIKDFRGLSLRAMAQKVNDVINAHPYILDNKNWGKTDYWETPVEFLKRGGDCEDFAIAKYTALRALGVPEDRLRLAIVHDKQKNIPHALLIVYADEAAYVLDNQVPDVRASNRVTRYRPIFSINRTAWWLHTAPGTTVVASAE